MSIPDERLGRWNDAPIRPERDWVVYWMTAQRRTHWNFALQHAVARAQELQRPLLILEALRAGYPWASDRLHRFILDGMEGNARRLAGIPLTYYAYVEPEPDAGSGLLEALAENAALVVADDAPIFFLRRMVDAAAKRLDVRLEGVDSNGLLPLAVATRPFLRAVDFRRFIQRALPEHLVCMPAEDPLEGVELPAPVALPEKLSKRWPNLADALAEGNPPDPADLPIDHGVVPASIPGGQEAATKRLYDFLEHGLPRYQEGRLDIENPSPSGLSPYLHFGHISPHQIFAALTEVEDWSPDQLNDEKIRGQREGYWGMSANAEAFLDQLATWRELGYNTAHHQGRASESYDSLPEWAIKSLAEHAGDSREHLYELETLESATTYDELWNAAQRQLVRDGTIHNYLRMLWGKKILEWSPSPQAALDVMWHLNNKYALDGRNPNSTSGIFWCLGRYDRAWGPERPIFGKIRYMSSDSARRKLRLGSYLERYGSRKTMVPERH